MLLSYISPFNGLTSSPSVEAVMIWVQMLLPLRNNLTRPVKRRDGWGWVGGFSVHGALADKSLTQNRLLAEQPLLPYSSSAKQIVFFSKKAVLLLTPPLSIFDSLEKKCCTTT